MDKLKNSLQQFVLKLFKNSDQKYINVNASRKKAFWSNIKYSGHKIYDYDFLIEAINYLIDNTYVTYGPLLFRQTKGIPIGGSSSQDFADIHLIWREYSYMINLINSNFYLAKELSNSSRYIDDIDTLNFDGFSSIALKIYDKELTLEPSQTSGLEDDFLDVNVKIIDNKFVTKVYHKVDKFNFKVVSFPFPDSNIHSKILSNTFYSQLIRYLNICTYSSDFFSRFQMIYLKLCERGYSSEILKKTVRKFILVHPTMLEKYGFDSTSDCFDFCFAPRNLSNNTPPNTSLNALLSSQLSNSIQNSPCRVIVKYSPPNFQI